MSSVRVMVIAGPAGSGKTTLADAVAIECGPEFAAEHIDFDVDVTLGGAAPLVEVTPLYYGATADAWFRGESAFFTATGRYRLRAEARGARVFLAVTALEGDTPTLDLDAWASLS
jgi:predicted ATPase